MDDYQARRHAVFGEYVGPNARGLEIGPGYRPTFPKAMGYHVQVIDHCPTAELIAKYEADATVPAELVRQIEPVDLVWGGGSYADLPGLRGSADYVVACHVIEHAPDLFGFLKDCADLLRAGGCLLLAIPDRSCVLDYYRPQSSLGDVLLAHLSPAAYDLKSNLDELWLGALLDGGGAWTREHHAMACRAGRFPVPQQDVALAQHFWRNRVEQAFDPSEDRPYRDAHRWVLDPVTFVEIVCFLESGAGLGLRIESMPEPYGCEFYAVLRKDSVREAALESLARSRIDALRARRGGGLPGLEAPMDLSSPPRAATASASIQPESTRSRVVTDADLPAAADAPGQSRTWHVDALACLYDAQPMDRERRHEIAGFVSERWLGLLSAALRARNLDLSVLDGHRRVDAHPGLPSWWTERGNVLFVPSQRVGEALPVIQAQPGVPLPANSCLILNDLPAYAITLWGEGSFLYIAQGSRLSGAHIAIGAGFVFIGDETHSLSPFFVNCRNGGCVILEGDSLVGGGVNLMTDDCHAIVSRSTGRRLNPFGGTVVIRDHVWIGDGARILGNAIVERNNVVGTQSLVRGLISPPDAVLAGVPARVLRTGITWDFLDLPPDACGAAPSTD